MGIPICCEFCSSPVWNCSFLSTWSVTDVLTIGRLGRMMPNSDGTRY